MERKTCCAAAVTMAVAVAGCGGSGTLSRTELAKRGTAICRQEITTTQAVMRGSRSFKLAVARALPVVGKSIQQLAALKPPAELKATYATFVALERAGLSRIQQGLAGRHLAPLSHATASAEAQHKAQLGLSSCP